MRRRPLAIYLGQVSILKLADYLRGYEHAVENLKGPDPFLGEFREWIQHRFQSNHGWEHIILEQNSNEGHAINRFWQLLDEFISETKALIQKSKTPELSTNDSTSAVLEGRPKG